MQPIEIIIGSGSEYDPGAGATVFNIPSLLGASYYVQRSGYGTIATSTYEDRPAGGFTLLGGLTTSAGEAWFVFITDAGTLAVSTGNYTNGFNHSAVIAALKDRIGFRQPLGTGSPTLTSAVTTANSGRYFDDFHAIVTVDNIKATVPQVGASDADLITHLGNIRSAAIMRALNGVFPAAQVIDKPAYTFKRYGQNDQLDTDTGQFVGYEISVANTPDAAVQIDGLRLYLNGAVTFNVYLFKDGITGSVRTKEVTTVADSVTEVSLADWILGRGKWFIGYFQADIGSTKAYREQACEWNEACYYCAKPMQATATGGLTFDRNNIGYPRPAHGLNLEISSFKDYTTAIQKKSAMFDELIGLNLAYMVIEQILYAVRFNLNERFLKDQLSQVGIQLDLNGAAAISDSPQVIGIKQRIDRELRRVNQSFYPVPKSIIIDVD